MKKTLFVSIFLIVTLLAITIPAAADRQTPVGDQIRVRNASIEFSADTPFNIRHGWMQPDTDDAIGIFDFTLDVDGAAQPETFKWFYPESGDPEILYRIWVFNFPEGMAPGTHTFTGHWFAPCQYAVDNLSYPGPCELPNAKVETSTRTLTITFVP